MSKALVKIKLQSLSEHELRNVLATLSRRREEIADHYDWRPRVNCEGPELYALETAPLPIETAEALLTHLRGLIEVGHE
jgi:hypothetical protein